jgi:hypothetical protein
MLKDVKRISLYLFLVSNALLLLSSLHSAEIILKNDDVYIADVIENLGNITIKWYVKTINLYSSATTCNSDLSGTFGNYIFPNLALGSTSSNYCINAGTYTFGDTGSGFSGTCSQSAYIFTSGNDYFINLLVGQSLVRKL